MVNFIGILLQLLLLTASVNCHIGESCVHRRTKTKGICVDVKNCPGIGADLQKNRIPETCSTKGGKLIVCCPTPNRSVAEEKCVEYSNFNYQPSGFDNNYESTDRIIQGTNAGFGELPHFASLGYAPNDYNEVIWRCGGALISENFILTAAHCLKDDLAEIVQLGDVTHNSRRSVTYKIKKIYKHPNYNPTTTDYDLALIELTKKVKFSHNIKPICLPSMKETNLQKRLIVSGFGVTEDFISSDTLRKTTVSRLSINECARHFRNFNSDVQLCFGDRFARKDSCDGDSGGPLQGYDARIDFFKIYGIVSYGSKTCGTPGRPAVYTKVAHFVPWIEEIVWNNR